MYSSTNMLPFHFTARHDQTTRRKFALDPAVKSIQRSQATFEPGTILGLLVKYGLSTKGSEIILRDRLLRHTMRATHCAVEVPWDDDVDLKTDTTLPLEGALTPAETQAWLDINQTLAELEQGISSAESNLNRPKPTGAKQMRQSGSYNIAGPSSDPHPTLSPIQSHEHSFIEQNSAPRTRNSTINSESLSLIDFDPHCPDNAHTSMQGENNPLTSTARQVTFNVPTGAATNTTVPVRPPRPFSEPPPALLLQAYQYQIANNYNLAAEIQNFASPAYVNWIYAHQQQTNLFRAPLLDELSGFWRTVPQTHELAEPVQPGNNQATNQEQEAMLQEQEQLAYRLRNLQTEDEIDLENDINECEPPAEPPYNETPTRNPQTNKTGTNPRAPLPPIAQNTHQNYQDPQQNPNVQAEWRKQPSTEVPPPRRTNGPPTGSRGTPWGHWGENNDEWQGYIATNQQKGATELPPHRENGQGSNPHPTSRVNLNTPYGPRRASNTQPQADDDPEEDNPSFNPQDSSRPLGLVVTRLNKIFKDARLTFAGTAKESPKDFLQDLYDCITDSGENRDEAVRAVRSTLTDSAELWYKGYRRRKGFKTWKEFADAFRSRFIGVWNDEDIMDDLRARTQAKQEPISDFISSIEYIASHFIEPIREDKFVNIVKRNLLPEYRQYMLRERVTSIEKIQELGQELEREKEDAARYLPPRTRDKMFIPAAAFVTPKNEKPKIASVEQDLIDLAPIEQRPIPAAVQTHTGQTKAEAKDTGQKDQKKNQKTANNKPLNNNANTGGKQSPNAPHPGYMYPPFNPWQWAAMWPQNWQTGPMPQIPFLPPTNATTTGTLPTAPAPPQYTKTPPTAPNATTTAQKPTGPTQPKVFTGLCNICQQPGHRGRDCGQRGDRPICYSCGTLDVTSDKCTSNWCVARRQKAGNSIAGVEQEEEDSETDLPPPHDKDC